MSTPDHAQMIAAHVVQLLREMRAETHMAATGGAAVIGSTSPARTGFARRSAITWPRPTAR